jgi:hypothetical protein
MRLSKFEGITEKVVTTAIYDVTITVPDVTDEMSDEELENRAMEAQLPPDVMETVKGALLLGQIGFTEIKDGVATLTFRFEKMEEVSK